MSHAAVLIAHVGLVTLSVSLFLLRFAWALGGSGAPRHRALSILPHVIDTALLASGVWLVLLTRQFPFVSAWLSLKLLAVVAYVVLGSLALRRGRTRQARAVAGALALLVVAWIVVTARARDPLAAFSLLS